MGAAMVAAAMVVRRRHRPSPWCAQAFLRTLDRRHLSNGAAEILKMACIKDAELFNVLEAYGPEIISSHFQVWASPAPSLHRHSA